MTKRKERKKHKRHRSRDEELEVLKHNSKRNEPSEVIEIHGSSSEDGELSNDQGCDASNSPKISHRHRHKHSRHHAKKHKRSHNDEQPLDEERDHAKSHRSDSKKKQSRRDESNNESQKSRRLRNAEVEVKQESDSDDDRREPRIKSKVEKRPNHVKGEESSEERDRGDHSKRKDENSRYRHRREDRDQRVTSIKREDERDNGRRTNSNNGRNERHRARDNGDEFEWGKTKNSEPSVKGEPVDKAKPDFKLSGKLTEDRNTYNGVVIKYSEPPESRMPKKRWRLYQFKGQETLPTLYIHRQSAYLIGRDRKVVDLPVDHPSCSKQHAALQYRLVTFERPNGTTGKQIRLYVIDLESANGTFINGSKIEAKKYVELMEKDVIKFGFSSREYVLLHEQSKDDELSDEG